MPREYNADESGPSKSSFNRTQLDSVADIIVFSFLECFSILAMVGNAILLIVIYKKKYLEKPSFVLIFNLGLADIIHGFVTGSYFYPPIILKYNPFSEFAYRIMNVLDWTAWGITISHMAAISLDRLLAIVLYYSYPQIMTVLKIGTFSISCWVMFFGANMSFFAANLCCPIVPLPEYYTFDYHIPNISHENSTVFILNIYPLIYCPLEITVIFILAISNPATLLKLFQKYKRRQTMRVPGALLINVALSQSRLGSRREGVVKVSNFLNRDLKIFIQIISVTLVFFAYMFIYYLFFYVVKMSEKWATVSNSFFYSITHMINPIIYFCLNDEMRKHTLDIILCRKDGKKLSKIGSAYSNNSNLKLGRLRWERVPLLGGSSAKLRRASTLALTRDIAQSNPSLMTLKQRVDITHSDPEIAGKNGAKFLTPMIENPITPINQFGEDQVIVSNDNDNDNCFIIENFTEVGGKPNFTLTNSSDDFSFKSDDDFL